tara:strand:- start:1363 stop:1548 length:186 start_codon:yes stop_codon:yes gene_type:complete
LHTTDLSWPQNGHLKIFSTTACFFVTRFALDFFRRPIAHEEQRRAQALAMIDFFYYFIHIH